MLNRLDSITMDSSPVFEIIKMALSIPGELSELVWEYFLKLLFEKKTSIGISIVGPSQSGKTTLFDIIRNEHNAIEDNKDGLGTTNKGRTLPKITIPLGEKSLVIKDTKDYDGEISSTKNYKDLFKGADIVLFVFDMDQFLNSKTGKDYQQQIAAMLGGLNLHIKKKPVYFIGSRKDKLKTHKMTPGMFLKRFKAFLKDEGLEEMGNLYGFEALQLDKYPEKVKEFLEDKIYRYAK